MKSARAASLTEAFDVILWRRVSTCRVWSERGGWGPGQGGGGTGDTGRARTRAHGEEGGWVRRSRLPPHPSACGVGGH